MARAGAFGVGCWSGGSPLGFLRVLLCQTLHAVGFVSGLVVPRRDSTVVPVPLLSACWFRAELARRYKLLDSSAVEQWLGADSTVKLITKHSYEQNRPVIRSPFFALDSTSRLKK